MKEKIINSQAPKFFNGSAPESNPEGKFILLGLFYIFILIPALMFIRIFDLFTFFAIYICFKHIISKPNLIQEKFFIPLVIISILVLESCFLIVYIASIFFDIFVPGGPASNRGLITFFSFFFFLFYWIAIRIKSNPKNISEITKPFFYEFFQICGLIIFYFFVLKSIPEKDFSLTNFLITINIIAINLILLVSINIFAKRVLLISEILCYTILFGSLLILATANINHLDKLTLSFKNPFLIAIIIINFIGLAIIFFKNKKSQLEKINILLLFALMISFFISEQILVRFFYYFATFALLILIILHRKISTLLISSLFILMSIFILISSIISSASRGGGLGSLITELSFANIFFIPLITLISKYYFEKKLHSDQINSN